MDGWRVRGSSLRVDSARMAANPPTPIGVMAASVPPAIITSASPYLMMRDASPIECALVVHAVHVASFGPLALCRMLTCPAARLTMAAGIKKGEILRGPPFEQVGVLALDDVEPADARADVNAGALGHLFGFDFIVGHVQRFVAAAMAR